MPAGVDQLGGDSAQVSARADEQQQYHQQALEVEEGRLYRLTWGKVRVWAVYHVNPKES